LGGMEKLEREMETEGISGMEGNETMGRSSSSNRKGEEDVDEGGEREGKNT